MFDMTAAPTLVAIGDNCLDVYIEQDQVAVGGSALNVAAQWRAAGLDARYLGAVGTDRAAELVRRGVRGAGLRDADVVTMPGPTGVTIVQLRDRDREFLFEELGVGVEWHPWNIAEDTRGAEWCHVTGTSPEAAIPSRLIATGRRVSVDLLGRPNGEVGDIRGVEIAFTSCDDSRDEAVALAEGLLTAGASTAVVMRGVDGSLAMHSEAVFETSAETISPVDTCGAGDSFIAAFVADRVVGGSIEGALATATRAATRTCLHLGGFPQSTMPVPEWLLARYADEIVAG